HAASTIKLAVLLGVFAAVHKGKLVPQSRLHVRNRFRSAYDGSAFRVLSERDADSQVQAAVGKTMRMSELARNMIVRSSNLSTIAHDAGIVYMPKRKPYIVAILTEWEPETTGRSPTIAAASYLVYDHLMAGRDEDDE